MTKNPYINALGASAYIFLVVGVMNYLSKILGDKPDTFFAPILALFMLTLSVAVIGFIFFYYPVQLFLDGKKKEGTQLFTKTVLMFGAITVVVLTFLLAGVI